jgi:primary-amine oxidase
MIPFLRAEHADKANATKPVRVALIHFNRGGSVSNLHEVHVNLDTQTIVLEKSLAGRHSFQDTTEMQAMEKACLAAPEVQDALRLLQLPEGAVVQVECWTYGTDGMNDMRERIIMVCFQFLGFLPSMGVSVLSSSSQTESVF